jgi:transposase-like protein
MSQKAIKHGQKEDVSCKQNIVIERLLAGDTVTSAAQAAGVARETVHRWKKSDWQVTGSMYRECLPLPGGSHSLKNRDSTRSRTCEQRSSAADECDAAGESNSGVSI